MPERKATIELNDEVWATLNAERPEEYKDLLDTIQEMFKDTILNKIKELKEQGNRSARLVFDVVIGDY